MIRRFWRWLIEDDRAEFLRESARLLAVEIHRLSDEQQRDLFTRYPQLWWHVNRVAACVEMQAGEAP